MRYWNFRTIFIKNGHKITAAFRQINTLYLTLLRKKFSNLCVVFAFVVCWIIPNTIYTTTFFQLYSKNLSSTYLTDMLRFFPHFLSQREALPYYCIVLCCYVFKLLTELLKQIEIDIKMKQEFQEIFCYFIGMKRKLSKSLEDVKAAFSFLLFLLYCYLISNIFVLVTSSMSSSG